MLVGALVVVLGGSREGARLEKGDNGGLRATDGRTDKQKAEERSHRTTR